MQAILKWQYDQIMKELLLLQDHQSDPSCPCEGEGEMCVRKHLLTLEAYAQETTPMEENEKYKEKLALFALEAKEHRVQAEAALCGDAGNPEILEWSRQWRKAFEEYSLACETWKEETPR